jgi:hypothetical protein
MLSTVCRSITSHLLSEMKQYAFDFEVGLLLQRSKLELVLDGPVVEMREHGEQ